MKKLFFTSCLFLLFPLYIFAQTPTPTVPDTIKDEDEVVKIRTDLIQVDVVVTGKNGKQVTDLKREDFEILENGKKQEITSFAYVALTPNNSATNTSTGQTKPNEPATVQPPVVPTRLKPEQVRRTIALVVDDLGLSFQSMVHVRNALKKFVDEQMQPNDLVAIIRTADGMGATSQFTSNKQQLYAAIERVRWYPLGRIGAGSMAISDQTASENQSQQDSFTMGTVGALNYIVNGMRELPGRKAIVLLSDGMPLVARDDENSSEAERLILESIQSLTDSANRASVVINTVDARGLPASVNGRVSIGEASSITDVVRPNHAQYNTQEGMISIADLTGGRAFVNNNDIKGSIQTVLADQTGYYLIGYQPDSDTFDPDARRFNKLEVRLNRPGLNARYRSGFLAVADRKIVRPENTSVPQQMINALVSPFSANGINLRLNSLFSNDARNGSFIRSLLHVQAKDLKFTDEDNGDKKAVFDVVAYTFDDNGVPADMINETYTLVIKQDSYQQILDKGFIYRLNLPVKKPGNYQLRVALRDAQSGQIGAANQFIQVPDLKKGNLTLSGIVLQSLTKEQIQKIAQEQSLLVERKKPDQIDPETDTALRRFKIGSYLQYAYVIYNAKLAAAQPQLETQLHIFQDGKLVLERKPLPFDTKGQADLERIYFNGAMALPPDMAPGNYVLQVIVRDKLAAENRQIATQWIDFEISK